MVHGLQQKHSGKLTVGINQAKHSYVSQTRLAGLFFYLNQQFADERNPLRYGTLKKKSVSNRRDGNE